MDYHKNAPWPAMSRERLARMVVEDGVRLQTAASRFSISWKTAAKWVQRYRQHGAAGLTNRSSRPHCSPRQTRSFFVERVLALRRGHMPGYEIARRTGAESGLGQPHPAQSNHYYNHQRPHASLNYMPPCSRSDSRTTS